MHHPTDVGCAVFSDKKVPLVGLCKASVSGILRKSLMISELIARLLVRVITMWKPTCSQYQVQLEREGPLPRCILVVLVIISCGTFAPAAKADTVTFSLTANTCTGGCSPSPFGNVVITTTGEPANTVKVTETLTGATQFVQTGAGYALAFSVTGNPTLTIGSLTTGFSVGNALSGHSESKDGAGLFEYWIACSGCGSGASAPIETGPLSFTASASDLTPENFEVLNNKSYYLASDVLATYTGNVEATGFTMITPEPGALTLFGSGLIGLSLIFRRRLFAKT
jgi:putative component of membrane protein insertase Oxa1/YidC/SpoIIIJ protein YidD